MNSSKKHPKRKFWQSFWIVVFLLSSVFSAILVYVLRQETNLYRSLLVGLVTIIALADIIALFAIFFWKKWGWYLFAVSTAGSFIVGLLITANWLMPINDILPLVILGWVFRGQLEKFG
mgnify:CR=1 FL=1